MTNFRANPRQTISPRSGRPQPITTICIYKANVTLVSPIITPGEQEVINLNIIPLLPGQQTSFTGSTPMSFGIYSISSVVFARHYPTTATTDCCAALRISDSSVVLAVDQESERLVSSIHSLVQQCHKVYHSKHQPNYTKLSIVVLAVVVVVVVVVPHREEVSRLPLPTRHERMRAISR